jgi:GT2 family glycosyltransferase
MAKVSVQIVTWNSLRYIEDCLNSLQEQTFKDFSVLVVDNGSSDGTVEFVRSHFPTASVLQNFKNIGFAKANNQGIQFAQSEYVLVLNPDVIVTPDFLTAIIRFADQQPAGGSFGGKILKLKSEAIDRDEPAGLRKAVKSDIIDSTGLAIYRSRKVVNRGEGERDTSQYDRTEEVFGLTGACVVYRKTALADVALGKEYFDNDFFAYKEDIDLAWRLRLYGWSSWYLPSAICYHYRQLASAEIQSIKTVRRHRKLVSRILRSASLKNHFLLLIKNDQGLNILLTMPWFLARQTGLLLYSLLLEPFQWRTLGIFFGQLPAALHKRRIIMAHKKAGPRQIRQWFI